MMMLLYGAQRYAAQARAKLQVQHYEASCGLLLRSQNIMLELLGALDRGDLGDQIYDTLAGLYRFVHSRLVQANVKHEIQALDEAERILAHLSATWSLALEKDRAELKPVLAAGAAAAAGEAPPINLEG